MLDKVKQMLEAMLQTIKAKGVDDIEAVDMQHEYLRADDEGASMLSVMVKVDFKIEPKEEASPAPKHSGRGGEVH